METEITKLFDALSEKFYRGIKALEEGDRICKELQKDEPGNTYSNLEKSLFSVRVYFDKIITWFILSKYGQFRYGFSYLSSTNSISKQGEELHECLSKYFDDMMNAAKEDSMPFGNLLEIIHKSIINILINYILLASYEPIQSKDISVRGLNFMYVSTIIGNDYVNAALHYNNIIENLKDWDHKNSKLWADLISAVKTILDSIFAFIQFVLTVWADDRKKLYEKTLHVKNIEDEKIIRLAEEFEEKFN